MTDPKAVEETLGRATHTQSWYEVWVQGPEPRHTVHLTPVPYPLNGPPRHTTGPMILTGSSRWRTTGGTL